MPAISYGPPPSVASDIPSVVGNCVSKRHTFQDYSRIAAPDQTIPQRRGAPPLIDYTVYDWTIDFSKDLVTFGGTGGLMLSCMPADPSKNQTSASSARISTTRYMLYGRITARIKAVQQSGFVTSLITMSDIGDEIDWELVKNTAQTNVFYHQFEDQPPWNLTTLDPEFGKHFGMFNVTGGRLDDWHIYTIDWGHDKITWSIDGLVVKTFTRAVDGMNSTQVQQGMVPLWYPQTPSLVQFSLWDAGDNPSTMDWSGEADWSNLDPVYGRTAIFEYIDIQCYNDQDQPVDRWPPNTPDNRKGNGVVDPPMLADGSVMGQSNPSLVPNTNTSNLTPGMIANASAPTFRDPSKLPPGSRPPGSAASASINWDMAMFWIYGFLILRAIKLLS
ncbi:concanavalin A-like lectin/glucanase domain-containing protein [Polychytrium aggregatum]|uniref:concanavalin A-like lectin/glucanase domain-containing protein n=1 Tax=Polychytrium aggregatum TaxID=110093 RepID=UPI0022FE3834|nr:concanavalin A-like lectin/glucanase domain-containing protein [Polychytrium aggregatum]KAI9209398.1 concanavalin A-like lectin/glucanase domain-containing protein [Polychytrium aggregatum]